MGDIKLLIYERVREGGERERERERERARERFCYKFDLRYKNCESSTTSIITNSLDSRMYGQYISTLWILLFLLAPKGHF